MAQPNVKAQMTPEFAGVNLRRDTVMIADNELASASNVDFYAEPGVLRPRSGITEFTTTSKSAACTYLAKLYRSYRYTVIGASLYADDVSQSSLLTGATTTMAAYRPLNDLAVFMFIANAAVMKKHNATGLTKWGIDAPTATPVVAVGAAGSLTGDYSIRFTYARVVGGVICCESSPSPVSNTVTLAANVLSLSGLTDSTDSQVTHKIVYRTTSGGASYLRDQMIATGTTTGSSTQADTALTDLLETDNDPPPNASWCWTHLETMFFVQDDDNPHYLWYSKRFLPEQVPPENFLEVGTPNDPLQCGVSHAGACGVFSRATKYQVIGNDASGYLVQEAPSHRGTPAPHSVCVSEYGVIFLSRDGIFSTTFGGVDTKLSDAIEGIFLGRTVNGYDPINWAQVGKCYGRVWKGRYFFAYPSGSNTTPDIMAVYSFTMSHWSFYDLAVTALNWEEDDDRLMIGQSDGSIHQIESGTSDNGTAITMTAVTKDYVGGEGPTIWKLFQWLQVDADTGGETVTVQFYVNDVLRGTLSVSTTARTTQLFDLAEAALGQRWHARISYTGTKTPKVYHLAALYTPLSAA